MPMLQRRNGSWAGKPGAVYSICAVMHGDSRIGTGNNKNCENNSAAA